MAQAPVLTPEEVQLFIQDYAENNYLLDGTEFTPTHITLCIELAVGEFNLIQPLSGFNAFNFPNKALLLNGTLYKLFSGAAAKLARNTMNYSDGGLQIPVEERYQLYADMANHYQQEFRQAGQAYKISTNMAEGWGSVASDYSAFPSW